MIRFIFTHSLFWIYAIIIFLIIPHAYSMTPDQTDFKTSEKIKSKEANEESLSKHIHEEPTDSAKEASATMLQEYVVTGKNAYYKDGVLTVIPTKREKERADGGNELLKFLLIPQLIYDPSSNTVNHISGDLAMYINGIPASTTEINNLKTTDVRRVEYLDFPQDPRFDRNPHVVNFIVHQYQFGGYSRIHTENNLFFASDISSVYSKFSVDDWIADVIIKPFYSEFKQTRDDTQKEYIFNDEAGESTYLKEEYSLKHNSGSSFSLPVTLRLQLIKPNMVISNSVGYQFDMIPNDRKVMTTQYSGIYSETTDADEYRSFHSNSVSWSGYYKFMLPKRWSLLVSPMLSYSHGNNNNSSNTGIDQLETVYYKYRQNSTNLGYSINLIKSFNDIHSFFVGIEGSHNWNSLDYLGSNNARADLKNTTLFYNAQYDFHFNHLYFGVCGGIAHNLSSSNGIKRNDTFPYLEGYLNYAISNSQNFSFSTTYSTQSASVNTITSDIIQINNFLYVTGDPNVKNVRKLTSRLSWSWLPSHLFQISIGARYNGDFNRITTLYTTYDHGKGILRSYVNDGNRNFGYVYANIGLRNLANRFYISVIPSLAIYHETGFYANTMTSFGIDAFVDCLLDHGFTLSASYHYTGKSYNAGTISRHAQGINFTGKWSWKNLHIALRLESKPFAKGWTTHSEFKSEVYRTDSYTDSQNSKFNISLSLSYLFSYGKKKLLQNDEVNGLALPESGAISF